MRPMSTWSRLQGIVGSLRHGRGAGDPGPGGPPESVDRRGYRLACFPVLVRPAGLFARAIRAATGPLGRLRAYTDERYEVGSRLELDLLLPGPEESVTVLADVTWVDALPEGGPARYEVGMNLLVAGPLDLQRIDDALTAGEREA